MIVLGESNVYTIGFIGPHKVISTKLPAIGRQMAAQISSGNTTTRLLGRLKRLFILEFYLNCEWRIILEVSWMIDSTKTVEGLFVCFLFSEFEFCAVRLFFS